jgi:hypothetical protein
LVFSGQRFVVEVPCRGTPSRGDAVSLAVVPDGAHSLIGEKVSDHRVVVRKVAIVCAAAKGVSTVLTAVR